MCWLRLIDVTQNIPNVDYEWLKNWAWFLPRTWKFFNSTSQLWGNARDENWNQIVRTCPVASTPAYRAASPWGPSSQAFDELGLWPSPGRDCHVSIFVPWLVVEPYPSENDGVGQLGWFSIPNIWKVRKIKNVPNHQPAIFVSFSFSFTLLFLSFCLSLWGGWSGSFHPEDVGSTLAGFWVVNLGGCPAVKYYSSSELKAPVERAMDLVFSGERVILKLISLS